MRKSLVFVVFSLVITSCEYLPSFKNSESVKGVALARVFEQTLYESDMEKILPDGISESDSIIFVKGYIETWAKQQLLLHQAEINLQDKSLEFEKLVSDYHATLYINAYKEALVLDKLDTVITQDQIRKYYDDNYDNFKLNEELVQLKFVHTDSGRNDKRELIKQFRSKKNSDRYNLLLSRELEFKEFSFNDSIWVKLSDVVQKIEALKSFDKSKILKKTNFIQKEDSLGLYLVTVKDVLLRNEIAPMSYISPTIKQIILQKRKLELLRKIEVDLINDAIKKQYFEEY